MKTLIRLVGAAMLTFATPAMAADCVPAAQNLQTFPTQGLANDTAFATLKAEVPTAFSNGQVNVRAFSHFVVSSANRQGENFTLAPGCNTPEVMVDLVHFMNFGQATTISEAELRSILARGLYRPQTEMPVAPSVADRRVEEAAQAVESARRAAERQQEVVVRKQEVVVQTRDELSEAQAEERSIEMERERLKLEHQTASQQAGDSRDTASRQRHNARAAALRQQIVAIVNPKWEAAINRVSQLEGQMATAMRELEAAKTTLADHEKRLSAAEDTLEQYGKRLVKLEKGLKDKADRTYVDDQIAKFQACQQIHSLCVLNEQGEYVGAESEAEAAEEGENNSSGGSMIGWAIVFALLIALLAAAYYKGWLNWFPGVNKRKEDEDSQSES